MRRTINIIVIVLVVDILCGGALWYGFTTMQEKKTEETQLRKDLLVESQKGEKQSALQHSLELAEGDRKELEKYLFNLSEENQIRFISQMEELGTSTGAVVETRSLDISGSKVHGEFALKGTWSQLNHVLRLIEQLPTRVVISQFSIQRVGPADSKVREGSEAWSGSISIDITSLRFAQ